MAEQPKSSSPPKNKHILPEDPSETHIVPSQKIPAVPSQKIPAVPSQKIPAVPSQKIPASPSLKIPAVPSQKSQAIQIPFLTSHHQKIEEDSGPSVDVPCDPSKTLHKRHLSLEDKKKQYFFYILRRLLQEPLTLTVGLWDEDTHEGNTFRLVYQKKNCEVYILDAKEKIQWHDTVLTLNIYLKWAEGTTEPLSLEDLQRVHNELRFLGLENEKVDACFSLARNEFVKETWDVQRHSTLQIICSEVNRTFVAGGRHYAITVLYDDTKDTAAYYFPKWINKEWVVECRYG